MITGSIDEPMGEIDDCFIFLRLYPQGINRFEILVAGPSG